MLWNTARIIEFLLLHMKLYRKIYLLLKIQRDKELKEITKSVNNRIATLST